MSSLRSPFISQIYFLFLLMHFISRIFIKYYFNVVLICGFLIKRCYFLRNLKCLTKREISKIKSHTHLQNDCKVCAYMCVGETHNRFLLERMDMRSVKINWREQNWQDPLTFLQSKFYAKYLIMESAFESNTGFWKLHIL